jgi:hypothetical protein
MNAKQERRIAEQMDPEPNEWVDGWEDESECFCHINEFGETEEWCDNCMFGHRRAAYYRAREVAAEVIPTKEQIQDRIITQNIQYYISFATLCLTQERRVETIGTLLRYLWDKQDFLKRTPSFKKIVIERCEEWEKDSESVPILSTIIATQMILRKIE